MAPEGGCFGNPPIKKQGLALIAVLAKEGGKKSGCQDPDRDHGTLDVSDTIGACTLGLQLLLTAKLATGTALREPARTVCSMLATWQSN